MYYACPRTFNECNEFSRKSHKSPKVLHLLDDFNKRLDRLNVTRSRPEYLLVLSILLLGRKTIKVITNDVGQESLSFTSIDFVVLDKTVNILKLFAEFTKTRQSETTTTVNMVVPSTIHIIDHLQQMDQSVSLLKKLIGFVSICSLCRH